MSGKIIDVSDNLNYDSSKIVEYPDMQVYKNELYCVWKETNDNNYQIKIKKYNGNSWSEISKCLNYDSSKEANHPVMQVYRDELYCAWQEIDGRDYKIKIKKYNGTSWSDVSNNLNYDSSKGSEYLVMQVYKDELYCVWNEYNGGIFQIKVKKFDGSTWSNVSSCLNYNSSKSTHYPHMQAYKDELYCVWSEDSGPNYQIRMKKYNGNTWSNVSDSLNYDSSKAAYYPYIQVYKDELYCLWSENNGSNYRIKMKKYNGNTWSNVSDCLNYNSSKAAEHPNLQIYKNELYCVWGENNGSNYQIKMKKYDENNWIEVSNYLNYDASKYADYPVMQVYNNELYCIWCEYNENNIYQIKVKKYYSITEKFLIKQNGNYISIKPEFYKNGKYQPLILEGNTALNDNDFINNGFDDLDDLCKEVSVENNIIKVKSNASNYEEGKIFSFDIDSEFKNINNIE